MTERTIAFDVDGTLIHQVGPLENTPRYEILNLYLAFQSLGWKMYVWSGGGVYYAQRWAEKLGLHHATVVEKGSFQPDIAVDDMAHTSEFNLGKVNIAV